MSNYIYTSDGELMHYGVKGMKWGVRRASKQYDKYMSKARDRIAETDNHRVIEAHNKTADEWNDGKIKKFDKTHNPKSKNYDDDLMKTFEKDFNKTYNKMLLDDLVNDQNYKKGQTLCDKYKLADVNNFAKETNDFVEQLKRES